MTSRSRIFRFETEAAMCAAFIASVDKRVWTAYAETGGFDLVMVHRRTGLQVGIEAKQSLNVDVVKQAVEHMRTAHERGPDFHAILVPEGNRLLQGVVELVGVTTIRCRGNSEITFWPQLPQGRELEPPSADGYFWESRTWFQLAPPTQIKLPDYVPDAIAGSPSPVTLTDWKIRAIKIAVLLSRRGEVSKDDFDALKISRSRWVQLGWIRPIRRGVYHAGRLPDFRAQHPLNYVQIEADFDKWAPLPRPRTASTDLPETLHV